MHSVVRNQALKCPHNIFSATTRNHTLFVHSGWKSPYSIIAVISITFLHAARLTLCIYIYKQVHIYTYIYIHTKCHAGKDEHTLHQFKKTQTHKFSSRKHMEHGLNHFWIRTTQTPGTPSWTYQILKKQNNLIYKTTRSISSQIYQCHTKCNHPTGTVWCL